MSDEGEDRKSAGQAREREMHDRSWGFFRS